MLVLIIAILVAGFAVADMLYPNKRLLGVGVLVSAAGLALLSGKLGG